MKRLFPLVLAFVVGISGNLFADTTLISASQDTVVATQAALPDRATRADNIAVESTTKAPETTEASSEEATEAQPASQETSEESTSSAQSKEAEETTEKETEKATEKETTTVIYASKSSESGSYIWPAPSNSKMIAGYPAYASGGAHHGIDIGLYNSSGTNISRGNPIYATRDGVVVTVYNDGNWNTGFGNYCIIDHGNGVQTLYAHAQEIHVSEGDRVGQGEVIGLIGDTGNTTAPHLHFEVRVESSGSYHRTNPLKFVSEP